MQLKVLDLFAGLEGWSKPFRERGHQVFSVDIDKKFKVDLHRDIMELKPTDIPWIPDVVLASPPCNCFSVASIGRHWTGGKKAYIPKSDAAKQAILLLNHTMQLIDTFKWLNPRLCWIVENPVGVMRQMRVMQNPQYRRETITYCSYGENRMKPTDLWGGFPHSLKFKPRCKNGDPCHEAAPRGSKTGTQGIKGAALRAVIPYALALDVCKAVEQDLAQGVKESEVA